MIVQIKLSLYFKHTDANRPIKANNKNNKQRQFILFKTINLLNLIQFKSSLQFSQSITKQFNPILIILLPLRNRIFQMPKNSVRKELTDIENQIDTEVSRIDRLLSKLSQLSKSINCGSTGFSASALQLLKNKQNCFCEQPSNNTIMSSTNQQLTSRRQISQQFYQFLQISQSYDEQILLDDYQHHYNNEFIDEIYLQVPKTIKIQTKFNWIDQYLDHSDCVVKIGNQQERLEIVYGQKGKFMCKNQDGEIVERNSQYIYQHDELTVEFNKHLRGYALCMEMMEGKRVFQLQIIQKTRILLEILNQSENVQRVVLVRQIEQNQKYQIIWGNYSNSDFISSLILTEGKYIILPLTTNPQININIYFQNNQDISLKADTDHPVKTYNLLSKSFQQCSPSTVATSRWLQEDKDSKRQYFRSCYMDLGIVVEIYENIHAYEAKFIDSETNVQDLQLLFSEIYSQDQLQNRLAAGQKIIKFYGITQQPARLFVPKKSVLMGSQRMNSTIIHSVFK